MHIDASQALLVLATLLAAILYALLVHRMYMDPRGGHYYRERAAYRLTAAGNILIALTTAALMRSWQALLWALVANVIWGAPQVGRAWWEEYREALTRADLEATNVASKKG